MPDRPTSGPTASGITLFRHPERSMEDLHARLEKGNVASSLRYDREERDYLRLSPHFYNTEAELDAVLTHL